MFKYAFAALAMVASPVMAKPVYLTCGIYAVTLNEQSGTLAAKLAHGPTIADTLPATFTADTVSVVEGTASAGWEINRKSGAFKMTVAGRVFQEGTCKVAAAPARKF